MKKEVIIVKDLEAIGKQAAEIFRVGVKSAAANGKKFSVCLSGGKTPRKLYQILAEPPYRDIIPWKNVHVFWGDERCVPPDDPDSNYGMAYQTLLCKIKIPPENIHRMKGELVPEKAAEDYEAELKNFFDHFPEFDLIFLGLGDDGHTASLFPNTPVLHEKNQWAVGYYVDKVKMNRLTLTVPVFNQAANIVFLVSGKEKAGITAQVLQGPANPDLFPAQRIHTNGSLIWLLDSAAGLSFRTK